MTLRLQTESPADQDMFRGSSHEKVAENVAQIIRTPDVNIIGLEGELGSGKSTIINLLKNDKENKNELSFFYFDAWAHEGDPLRRIFLESLINSFKENEKNLSIINELEEKRKIISREKKTKHTKVTRSTTLLGLLMTVATLFFTIFTSDFLQE